MLVKAIKKCFVDGSRRRPGQVFTYQCDDPAKLPTFLVMVSEGEEAPASSPELAPDEVVIAGKVAKVPRRPKDFDVERI